jgi:predicted dehydrogenase
MRKPRAAILGLGFGAEFIPIWQNHPDTEMYAICQRDPKRLDAVGKAFGIDKRYTNYDDVLRDPDVDFVHINTPIPDHARMTLQALEAGKHVACTVPMATSIDDCRRIVEASARTGKKYMMMETVVYSREFLFIQELLQKGELGKLQFLQASHQQDMDGWPGYWPGLPPMHYATHCVGPMLGLPRKDAEYVSCFGSGTIKNAMVGIWGSPFAVETAHIKLRHSDLSARIIRSLFDVARQYRESIDVYGDKKAFEWPLIEGEKAVLHTAKRAEPEIAERIDVPDFAHRLPAGIRKFTQQGVYDLAANEHLSFTQGGGHGGSHPHLAHEFIRALVEDRDPWPNAAQSANWTCVGILAHESAMQGGVRKDLPSWTFSS